MSLAKCATSDYHALKANNADTNFHDRSETVDTIKVRCLGDCIARERQIGDKAEVRGRVGSMK